MIYPVVSLTRFLAEQERISPRTVRHIYERAMEAATRQEYLSTEVLRYAFESEKLLRAFQEKAATPAYRADAADCIRRAGRARKRSEPKTT